MFLDKNTFDGGIRHRQNEDGKHFIFGGVSGGYGFVFVCVFWLGVLATSFFFMVLHYLLYLRGYVINDYSCLFYELFYPPQF